MSRSLIAVAVLAAVAGTAFAAGQTTPPAPPAPMMHAGHPEGRMALDTNKDGRISRAEAAARPGLAQRFDAMDGNHDGFLDKADREQMRAQWQAKRGEMAKRHFAEMDANHDGRVSRDEMRAAMSRHEAEMQQKRDAMFDAHFRKMDANGDGFISADEMAKGHAAMGGMHGNRGGMGMHGGMKGMAHPMTPPPAR